MKISAMTARALLDYNPHTGALVWRERPEDLFPTERACKRWNNRFAAKLAGCVMARGYVQIRISGHLYYAHRLAWLIAHGGWPETIDHIDGNPSNNRLANLRSVTQAKNNRNKAMHSNNTSGVIGVSQYGGKWHARIKAAGKNKNLGRFDNFGDAVAARLAAECEYGYHANHGRVAV